MKNKVKQTKANTTSKTSKPVVKKTNQTKARTASKASKPTKKTNVTTRKTPATKTAPESAAETKVDSSKVDSSLSENQVVKVGDTFGIQKKGKIVLSEDGRPVVKSKGGDFQKVKDLVLGKSTTAADTKTESKERSHFTFAGLQ